MHMKCSEMFNKHVAANILENLTVKKIQNWLRINRVTATSLVSPFLEHSVHYTHTHPFTHPFKGPFSGTTRVGWYQKGKTNLDFTEARDTQLKKIGNL